MKAYSLDVRCVVINAYESGEETVEDVADQLGVGTAFVKKMLRVHRAGESLEPKHGGGAPAKLTAEGRDRLRAAVKTRPDATARRAQGGAAQRLPGGGERPDRVSGAAETGGTAKKKSFVASERNEPQRQAFRREVAELNVEDFVFVDEMGINLAA